MEQRSKSKYIWIGLGAIALVAVLWRFLPEFCPWTWWQDKFGAVESLFTGLAFALLIVTAIMQKEELELQRRELELTREEMRGQKEQLALQNETFKREQFESTFFSLLRWYGEVVISMVVPASTSGPETHGRDTLDRYAQSCLGFVARDFGESAASADEEKRAVLAKAYARFFQQYRADLAYYFRTLYNVVKFVDEHGPTDKAMYMNLLRASLSDGELVLLFFNCLSPEGRGLKPLVEKHRLLKHLRRDKETVEALRDLYASRAYGEVS